MMIFFLHICLTGDFSVSSFMCYQTFTCISNDSCAKFAYWVILRSCFVNPIQAFPLSDVCTWSHTLNQEVLLSLKSNTHGMEETLSALKVLCFPTVAQTSPSSAAWSGPAQTARRCRSREPPPPTCTWSSHRENACCCDHHPSTEDVRVKVICGVHPLYFEGNAETHHRRWLSIISFISGVLLQKKHKGNMNMNKRRAETEEQDREKNNSWI